MDSASPRLARLTRGLAESTLQVHQPRNRSNMNLSKKAHLSELRKHINSSAKDGLTDRHRVLKEILDCWNKKQSLLRFAYFLEEDSDRVVQSFVAEAFAYANDTKVLKHLMKATIAPNNSNYNSTFIWPCANYNCTKHLSFFVSYISKNDEPNEAMLACVYVIETMKLFRKSDWPLLFAKSRQ